MRKTTKLVALLLAVMMIVSCVPMFVSAETAGSITVESKTVEPSATDVTVDVTFTGSFLAAQFDLAYDEGLVLVDVACDDLTITKVDGTNSFKAIAEAKQPEDDQDPALADVTNPVITLTFNAPATEGEYDVSVSNVDAADYDEQTVTFDDAEGTITVEAATITPVLNDALDFFKVSCQYTDKLGIAYILKNSDFAAYDHIEVMISRTRYDGDFNEYKDEAIAVVPVDTGSYSSAILPGVGMCELGLDVDAYIKCYDAKGNFVAYSKTKTISTADGLKELYHSYDGRNTDTAKKTRALITDTLNMGAEAQKYFAAQRPQSELASATLINDGWDQTAATESLGTLTNAETSTWVGAALGTMRFSVGFSSTPATAFTLVASGIASKVDNLELDISYTTTDTQGVSRDITKTVTGSEWSVASNNAIAFNFADMLMYDTNKTINATLKNDGVVVWNGTYSVDSYILSKQTDKTVGALAVSLGKFAVSVRAYFNFT